MVVLALAAWLARAPLLTGLANAWIIDQAPQKADAIVVLGGGVDYRPFAAARLFKAGWAPIILIMDVNSSPTERLGFKEPERSVTRQVLLHEGVPEAAIVPVGQAVKNTFDESRAVRQWAGTNGAARLLVVTESFHTRRARWVFRKQFRGAKTEITMCAASPEDYRPSNWWQNEQGLINFENEWFKFPYYLLTH